MSRAFGENVKNIVLEFELHNFPNDDIQAYDLQSVMRSVRFSGDPRRFSVCPALGWRISQSRFIVNTAAGDHAIKQLISHPPSGVRVVANSWSDFIRLYPVAALMALACPSRVWNGRENVVTNKPAHEVSMPDIACLEFVPKNIFSGQEIESWPMTGPTLDFFAPLSDTEEKWEVPGSFVGFAIGGLCLNRRNYDFLLINKPNFLYFKKHLGQWSNNLKLPSYATTLAIFRIDYQILNEFNGNMGNYVDLFGRRVRRFLAILRLVGFHEAFLISQFVVDGEYHSEIVPEAISDVGNRLLSDLLVREVSCDLDASVENLIYKILADDSRLVALKWKDKIGILLDAVYQAMVSESELVSYLMLWTCIEGALIRDGNQGIGSELAFKIASIMEGPEKMEIFDMVKKAYNARSRIAHGFNEPRDLKNLMRMTLYWLVRIIHVIAECIEDNLSYAEFDQFLKKKALGVV